MVKSATAVCGVDLRIEIEAMKRLPFRTTISDNRILTIIRAD